MERFLLPLGLSEVSIKARVHGKHLKREKVIGETPLVNQQHLPPNCHLLQCFMDLSPKPIRSKGIPPVLFLTLFQMGWSDGCGSLATLGWDDDMLIRVQGDAIIIAKWDTEHKARIAHLACLLAVVFLLLFILQSVTTSWPCIWPARRVGFDLNANTEFGYSQRKSRLFNCSHYSPRKYSA